MGYSARYHVASLAAVFLALGVGILIGTGLNTVVTDATHNLEDSLKSDLAAARSHADDLQHELDRQNAFGQAAYPGLVAGVLRHERVSVVGLGARPDDLTEGDFEQVVGPTAITGGRIQNFAVVGNPTDVASLRKALSASDVPRHQRRAIQRSGDFLDAFYRAAGRSLVLGGPFFDVTRSTLLKASSRSPQGTDAVLVTREAPKDNSTNEATAIDRLHTDILDGMRHAGAPVVGVESTTTDPSSISLFAGHGISSVDDIDAEAGQVALAYALRGVKGSFGVKSTADRLLPELAKPPRRLPGAGPARP